MLRAHCSAGSKKRQFRNIAPASHAPYSGGAHNTFFLKPKELYKAICLQEPSVPVFLQCWWMDAVTDAWNVAVSLKGDEVTGVWPYALQQKLTVTLMRNPRLTPYLGPHVFYPHDIKAANRDSFEHEVIAQLLEQLPYADVWMQTTQPGLKQVGLFRHQNLRVAVQQTFLLALNGRSEEEIFQNFKEPLRRNIRQAEGELAITEEPEMLATLHEYQGKTLDRKRVAHHDSHEDMERLMQACVQQKQGTLLVARKGTNIEALLWNVWDGTTSYYFAGAKNPASGDHRAMSALLWHAIRMAKARGNDTFDLEGSMDQGVEQFFRKFGAQRELYLVLRKNGHWLWRLSRMFKRD